MTQTIAQTIAREIAGSTAQFNEDLHAAFDVMNVPGGQLAERMQQVTGLPAGPAFNTIKTYGPMGLYIDFTLPTIDSRITFTRGSTATYLDAAGAVRYTAANTPRFEFDPITGESKGLLLEESRTNLLLRSAEFDNASWAKNRLSVVANAVTAPDGSLTADKLQEDSTASSTHYTYQLVIIATATSYTALVFLKAAGRNWAAVSLYDGTSHYAWFDLANGVVGTVQAGNTARIKNMGNGWYCCSVTRTTANSTTGALEVYCSSGDGLITHSGDGTSGLYIWGAQLEAGDFATSYIPTTSAQVTRAADIASITGTNFSSWYRQNEGAFYIESSLANPSAGSNQFLVCVSDNSYNNQITVLSQSNGYLAITTTNGGTSDGSAASTSLTSPDTLNKASSGYKLNDLAFSLNGAEVVTDSSALIPSGLTRLDIGSDHLGANHVKRAVIRRILYYPTRLSNAIHKALSS